MEALYNRMDSALASERVHAILGNLEGVAQLNRADMQFARAFFKQFASHSAGDARSAPPIPACEVI